MRSKAVAKPHVGLSNCQLLETYNIRTSLLIPVLEVVLANFGASLERVPHVVTTVHHETDMMDALRVVAAIALATKENGVASSPVCKLDFPVVVLEQRKRLRGNALLVLQLAL